MKNDEERHKIMEEMTASWGNDQKRKRGKQRIVVESPPGFHIAAWFMMLLGAVLVVCGLLGLAGNPEGANGERWIPAGFGVFFLLIGIWLVGTTTKVIINEPSGYMTVTRGHVPLFLWFLRTKVISREEARSVFVRSVEKSQEYGTRTEYQVRVTRRSGKKVKLYEDLKRDKADYLAKRILEFAQGSGRRSK